MWSAFVHQSDPTNSVPTAASTNLILRKTASSGDHHASNLDKSCNSIKSPIRFYLGTGYISIAIGIIKKYICLLLIDWYYKLSLSHPIPLSPNTPFAIAHSPYAKFPNHKNCYLYRYKTLARPRWFLYAWILIQCSVASLFFFVLWTRSMKPNSGW